MSGRPPDQASDRPVSKKEPWWKTAVVYQIYHGTSTTPTVMGWATPTVMGWETSPFIDHLCCAVTSQSEICRQVTQEDGQQVSCEEILGSESVRDPSFPRPLPAEYVSCRPVSTACEARSACGMR